MRFPTRGYELLIIAMVGCSAPRDAADAGDPDADLPPIDAPADAPADAPKPPDLTEMCGAVPTTVAEWEACYVKRYCEMRVHCGEHNLFTDVTECIDYLDRVEGGRLSFELFEKQRAVAAARASVDVAAFTTCLIEQSPNRCETAPTEPSCALRYTGTIADGQSCYSDVECASPGATCEPANCGASCCLGTCVAKKKLGEPCMDFFACEPGLQCSITTLKCVDGDVGSSCTNTDCDMGAWCDTDAHLCRADLAEGAPCDSIAQCGGETSCVGLRRPVEPAKCRRISEPGDACDWYCMGNLYCDLSDPNSLGVCRPLPTLGQSCSDLLPCTGRLNRCVNGQCVRRADVGEPCTDGTCLPGLFCTDQVGAADPVCSVQLPDNATGCNQPSQCQSHVCDGDQTATGDCQPLQATCP